MKAIGLIPSRYASTRLAAKALLAIDGLPVIVHVYKRCKLAKSLDDVCVCTDSEEIGKVVEHHGGKVIYASSQHTTGTDRVAEAAKAFDADLVVDVYGDEPLVSPYNIDAVVEFHRANPKPDILLTPSTARQDCAIFSASSSSMASRRTSSWSLPGRRTRPSRRLSVSSIEYRSIIPSSSRST